MLNNLKKLKEKYVLIAIFLLIFIMSYLTPFTGDEYVYSFIYRTNIKIKNIIDVLISSFKIYILWSGRVLPNFFQALFPFLGKFMYSVFNSLIFILILKKSEKLLQRYNQNITFKGIDYIILLSLNWFLIPVFNQDFIGIVSSINHSWMLLILICFILELDKKRETNKIRMLFSFLVGLTHESVIIFINLLLMYRIFILKRKDTKTSTTLSLWGGSVTNFFSW